MKLVTLIMKMCQVVIRHQGDYAQVEPEVADYYEPFRDFFSPDPKSLFSKDNLSKK